MRSRGEVGGDVGDTSVGAKRELGQEVRAVGECNKPGRNQCANTAASDLGGENKRIGGGGGREGYLRRVSVDFLNKRCSAGGKVGVAAVAGGDEVRAVIGTGAVGGERGR